MKKKEKRFQQSLAALVKNKAKDGLKTNKQTKKHKGKTATNEDFIKSYLCQALAAACSARTGPASTPTNPTPAQKTATR